MTAWDLRFLGLDGAQGTFDIGRLAGANPFAHTPNMAGGCFNTSPMLGVQP